MNIKLITDITDNIIAIKTYAFKVRTYEEYVNEQDIEPELKPSMLFMPEVDLTGVNSLEELHRYTNIYLSNIPAKTQVKLSGIPIEEMTNKYKNEIPLYEAEAFMEKLESLLSDVLDHGDYYVSLYDLNDQLQLRFSTQEEAEAFARAVAPSTVYHVEDGKSEIVSY